VNQCLRNLREPGHSEATGETEIQSQPAAIVFNSRRVVVNDLPSSVWLTIADVTGIRERRRLQAEPLAPDLALAQEVEKRSRSLTKGFHEPPRRRRNRAGSGGPYVVSSKLSPSQWPVFLATFVAQ